MKKTERKRIASRETEQRQMADLLVCFFRFGHGFGPGLLGLKKLFMLFFALRFSETLSLCYGFCSCVFYFLIKRCVLLFGLICFPMMGY